MRDLSRKVATLGLDGVPFELLNSLMDKGVMPNLASIASDGFFSPMTTTIPPISSVAWTSFATGVGPEAHGIFGFTDFSKGSLSLRLPSFDDVKAPPLWKTLGTRGIRTIVVNLPFAYPARPMEGILIAGFVAPLFERAVYPDTLLPWLQRNGYRIDVDLEKGRYDRDALMEDLFDTLTVRARVILDLVGSERWDLFIAVITGTDRLHHFFFDAAYDESHPRRRLFIDYYRKLDDFIGRFNELIGHDTTFMALSDHGFTLLREQIYLNTILQRMGFLKYGSGRPGRLEDVSKNSLAVALDPTRIYVIHRGRFRESGRPESEAPTIINQLKQSLESLTYSDMGLNPEHTSSDSPLFERVLDSVFLYKNGGGYDLPDLVCVPSRGVEVKAAIGAPHTHGKDIFTGTHTHDNAFLLIRSPGGIDAPIEPHITDAARFILSELGSGILL